MRRGRDAAAPTSRAMRPLVFLLVALFLVLPTLVYNFVTLDYERLTRWSGSVGDSTGMRGAPTQAWEEDDAPAHSLPPSLEACASVTVTDMAEENKVKALRARCFTPSTTTGDVPDLVHFVYLPVQMVPLLEGEAKPAAEDFTLVQFAAVQSVRKALKPMMMVLHYPATEPRSFWYTQCQRYLSLHRVVFPALATTRRPFLNIYQRRDVMQLLIALRALRKQGGVAFTDFNTFVLKPLPALRHLPLVIGRSHTNSFSVSTSMISATARNEVIVYLEAKLREMFEGDDPRLHSTPLDRVVSDLLTDKMTKASQDDSASSPGLVATERTVLGAVPPSQLTALLTARVSDALLSLRGSVAFRFPPTAAVAESRSNAHAAAELVRVQNKLVDFPALTGERTLFGAVLRYVTSTNRTAELDDILAS